MTGGPTGRLATVLALSVALAGTPAGVLGQDAGEGPWSVEGELGTSLTFGASDQSVLLLRSGAEHESERVVFAGEAGFEYGEARESDEGAFVNKRSWTSSLSLDYTPEGRVSPFVSLSAEGSLERRIDLRVQGGMGARYRFDRGEGGRLDLSVAALVERTEPRHDADGGEVETLARGSARIRARRSLKDGGLVLDLVSFYRPALEEPVRDFTVEFTSSVTFSLTGGVGLKLSIADRFDSLAEERGARDNHDGRLFFSLSAATR